MMLNLLKSSSIYQLSRYFRSATTTNTLTTVTNARKMMNAGYHHLNPPYAYRGFNITDYDNSNSNIHDDKVSISVEIIDQ